MFSRWLVTMPMKRHFAVKSFVANLSRDSSKIQSHHRHKHKSIQAGATMKSNSKENEEQSKLKMIQGPFRDQPTSSALFPRNDSDTFGSFDQRVLQSDEVDEGDLADDEYYRKIPMRRDQLPPIEYQHMVRNHIRNRQLKEAIDILEVRMKEDRVKPNYYIYELLIIECGRSGYTKKAFQLYNDMKKRGLQVNGPVYAALFNACAKTIHPKTGLQLATNLRKILLQTGYQTNEIIYNAMIKAFGRCGDIATAFQLVDEMKSNNLNLKIDTMNHLLQVSCSDKEYGFRHALYIWHKIYQRKLAPDVFSFNLMIRCTRDCHIGDLHEMKKVIATILESSKALHKLKMNKKEKEIQLIEDKPSTPINANVENDLPDTENIEPKSSVTDELHTNEVCDQMPNLLSKLPHLGSIVRLSMVNTSGDRFKLLGGLTAFIDEMEKAKVRPNVKTFSQLLDVIDSTRDAEHELIQKMRYMRVRADTDFFNLLMRRRIVRKDYDGAMEVLDMIDRVHLNPDIVTYGIMAMACISREQAQQFLRKLDHRGIRINIEILGALLGNATFIFDYDYVIDVLDYAINEQLRPSSKFYQIVSLFNYECMKKLKSTPNEEEQRKFNAFVAIYKNWKKQFGLNGVQHEEIMKLLEVHPWKQLKEAEGDGIEMLKNERTRRLWKRQHALKVLTPNRLNKLRSENLKVIDNSPKMEEIDEK